MNERLLSGGSQAALYVRLWVFAAAAASLNERPLTGSVDQA